MKITDAINQVTESHPIQFAHPSQDYIYCVPVLTEGDLKFKVITCDSGCLGDGMLPGYMTGLTQQTWVHSLCLCTSASHTVSLHTGHTKEIILAHIVKMIACNSQHLVSYAVTHVELHCTSSLALGASNMSSYWRGCTEIRRHNATQANSVTHESCILMHALTQWNTLGGSASHAHPTPRGYACSRCTHQ